MINDRLAVDFRSIEKEKEVKFVYLFPTLLICFGLSELSGYPCWLCLQSCLGSKNLIYCRLKNGVYPV